MPKSKKPIVTFWEYFFEVFTEPVFLVITVSILLIYYKGIWDTSPTLAIFLDRINANTVTNMVVAFLFLAVIAIWMVVVMRRFKREARRDARLAGLLRANARNIRQNSKDIKQLTESIQSLVVEMRTNRENR